MSDTAFFFFSNVNAINAPEFHCACVSTGESMCLYLGFPECDPFIGNEMSLCKRLSFLFFHLYAVVFIEHFDIVITVHTKYAQLIYFTL